MSDLFWLSEAQVDRPRPFFPKSRGKLRVDDPLPSHGMSANREYPYWSRMDFGPFSAISQE